MRKFFKVASIIGGGAAALAVMGAGIVHDATSCHPRRDFVKNFFTILPIGCIALTLIYKEMFVATMDAIVEEEDEP